MSNLDRAIAIATQAHAGQLDKSGQPYILHPLRLMLKFQDCTAMMVAVMHDVVEDSDFSLVDLKNEGFAQEVVEAVDCLSKRAGENYDDFLARVLPNKLARKVKIEDIKDNLDVTRLNKISDKDLARIEKYHRALKLLHK